MHRRFICLECHMKWFVQASSPREDDPTHCRGCGGELVVFADPDAARQAAPEAAPPG